MAPPKVFFVYLRRPGTNDARTDPLYEFGSFGCTTCHSRNLFHPRHAEELEGARLAFVQGGDRGARLVFLTPPITIEVWPSNCEARWTPAEMPFKYTEAPVLASNDGSSDFPSLEQFVRETDCPTVESGLSSRLRSRARPLPVAMAKQVISVYERQRKKKPHSAIAATYYEALPYVTKMDRDRKNTHQRLIRKLRAKRKRAKSALNGNAATPETQTQPRCGSSRRRQSKRRRCS